MRFALFSSRMGFADYTDNDKREVNMWAMIALVLMVLVAPQAFADDSFFMQMRRTAESVIDRDYQESRLPDNMVPTGRSIEGQDVRMQMPVDTRSSDVNSLYGSRVAAQREAGGATPFNMVSKKLQEIESQFGRAAQENMLLNVARGDHWIASDFIRSGIPLDTLVDDNSFVAAFNDVYKGINDGQAYSMGWILLFNNADHASLGRLSSNSFFDQPIMEKMKSTLEESKKKPTGTTSKAGSNRAGSSEEGSFGQEDTGVAPSTSMGVSVVAFWEDCVKKPNPNPSSYSFGGGKGSDSGDGAGGFDDKPITPTAALDGKSFKDKCGGFDPAKLNKGESVGKTIGTAAVDGSGTVVKSPIPANVGTVAAVYGMLVAKSTLLKEGKTIFEYELNVQMTAQDSNGNVVTTTTPGVKVTVSDEKVVGYDAPKKIEIKLKDGTVLKVDAKLKTGSGTGTLKDATEPKKKADTAGQDNEDPDVVATAAMAMPTYDSDGANSSECKKLTENANNNCILDGMKKEFAGSVDVKCDTMGVYGQPGVDGGMNCIKKTAPMDAVDKQWLFNKSGGGVTDPGYNPSQDAQDSKYKQGGENY
jgi:hypothetical protein